jgi:hypothetical protein
MAHIKMAKQIIAGRSTPASRGNSTTHTDGPSAADLLENRLTQLKSLLWCCYGDGIDWFDGAGPKHLDNVIWLVADWWMRRGSCISGVRASGLRRLDTRELRLTEHEQNG